MHTAAGSLKVDEVQRDDRHGRRGRDRLFRVADLPGKKRGRCCEATAHSNGESWTHTALALADEEDLDGPLLFLEGVAFLADLLVDGVVDPACLGLPALSRLPGLGRLVWRRRGEGGEGVVHADAHHVPSAGGGRGVALHDEGGRDSAYYIALFGRNLIYGFVD